MFHEYVFSATVYWDTSDWSFWEISFWFCRRVEYNFKTGNYDEWSW